MLEPRLYKFAEIAAYLHAGRARGVRDKLTRYDVDFIEGGGQRDQTKTYEITAIHDPFKLFCVFDLGISPQTDFHKLRDFVFYLLTDDDFSWRPMEMMEAYLRRRFPNGASRQTISNYLRIFKDRELIADNGEYVYYKVIRGAEQSHEIITKADYSAAWAFYWDRRNDGDDSDLAFSRMYHWLGGVPRKQRRINQNAFYLDTLDRLEQYAAESMLAEYGEIL